MKIRYFTDWLIDCSRPVMNRILSLGSPRSRRRDFSGVGHCINLEVSHFIHRLYRVVCPTSTPCPNFGLLGFRTCCMVCYENNKSPFESWNKTFINNCCKTFYACKNSYFLNDEVRVGCPKLGQTTLSKDQIALKILAIHNKKSAIGRKRIEIILIRFKSIIQQTKKSYKKLRDFCHLFAKILLFGQKDLLHQNFKNRFLLKNV